ncbi:MAG: DUF5654 family protein [bacterium]|nr:DUF5654 family protein [bacterium]
MVPIIKAKEKIKETKRQVLLQSATLVNSAFALVAALAWNEAIKAVIDQFVPQASAIFSKFLYAFVLTLIVVIISMRLTKIINDFKPIEEEEQAGDSKK